MDARTPRMAGMTPTWAVIPSEGRSMLHDCIASLRGQVNHIIVVANGKYDGSDLEDVTVVLDDSTDRNISRWWNLGIKAVSRTERWNTLILNDDVIMGPGSVDKLSRSLRESTSVIAYPGHADLFLKERTLDRITGWCFMLRGEGGVLADEDFSWWYGDNDLDWRCRELGGARMVSAVDVIHRDPNGYTNRCPELAERTVADRQVFLRLWGRLPH